MNNMLIIELNYTKSLEEVEKFLNEHRNFLDRYYKSGVFIASGAKNPRNGGIIIAISDKNFIEEILKEDPFYSNNIAQYQIIEFHPTKYHEQLKPLLIKKTLTE